MTFSIVAFDPEGPSWGVAVASKCLSVGMAVPWGRAGFGAVATQALANLRYGPDGLALLEGGAAPDEVVRRLTDGDELRDQRQLGVVDARGRSAQHTGTDCLPWAGGTTGEGFSVQGNILAGPQVVDAMVQAYAGARGTLAQRLLRCLEAGDAAGGDRRGRQSAALKVWREGAAYGGGLDIAVDLRVDDHAQPIPELGRLLELYELYFGRPDPATLLTLDGDLAEHVSVALAAVGYDPADKGGLAPALDEWSGVENLEERMVAGKLDPVVLRILDEQAAAAT